MKIAIVTDSTADISDALTKKYNIKVIPLTVNFDGKAYQDRVDISNEEFYKYIATAKTLPTTSQPSPIQYIEAYRACKEEGADKIISIHFSAEMSGTFQGAQIAADLIKDEIDVEVIDSRTVTVGLNLQVLTIAQYIESHPDLEWDELIERIHAIIKETKIYFLLDSLDNLQKGGRIGKASYLVGSILNIKPLLIVDNGVIGVYEKVRGKKMEKAVDHLIDAFISSLDPQKTVYFILGSNNDAYLNILRDKLRMKLAQKPELKLVQLEDVQLGCVVTTHIGLGGFGIGCYQL